MKSADFKADLLSWLEDAKDDVVYWKESIALSKVVATRLRALGYESDAVQWDDDTMGRGGLRNAIARCDEIAGWCEAYDLGEHPEVEAWREMRSAL